ncbi:hypothetical protein B7486_66850, partial [cyanobacterium TDX16]
MHTVAISGDGRTVAFRSDDEVGAWVEGTGLVAGTDAPLDDEGEHYALDVDRAGQRVVFTSPGTLSGGQDGGRLDVFGWDPAGGEVTLLSTSAPLPGSYEAMSPSISDDGRTVLYATLHPLTDPPSLRWSVSHCSPFRDVGVASAFRDAIVRMHDAGHIEGYADGTFRPSSVVTRQAAAAILWRTAGAPETNDPDTGASDVPSEHPFATAIDWMLEEDVAAGYEDGTFRPGATVTRQALVQWLYRLAGSPGDPISGTAF